jgi:hypothetical protein
MTDLKVENRSNHASVASVDMKLEAVVIPVSDVERAEEFYKKLGWRQDVTPPAPAYSNSPRTDQRARSNSARTSRRPRPVQPRERT